jgi:hypothetical protein
MDDYWEVKYGVKDVYTHEYNVDPNDPTDAYDDPDNDGYDFNHNGKIDSYFDSVVLSELNVPKHVDYTDVNLNLLLANLQTYNNKLIRLEHASVINNGSYKRGLGDQVEFKRGRASEIVCTITFTVSDSSTMANIEICVESSANRPINLGENDTYVDIQGVFRVVEGVKADIVVRGGERFTNIMEYQNRHDYDNDNLLNETSPVNYDSDGDDIPDGWEVAFGKGIINTSLDPPIWQWIYHIDPTWDGDAFVDIDGDAIEYDSELRGHNYDEFLFGTDPTKPDTDQDSFDVNRDGYTPDDRNAIDFAEVFLYDTDPNNWDTDGDKMSDGWEIWYGLNATNPNDRFEDPDKDLLVNLDEFLLQTHPRKWDTDEDGMPDGWEAKYDLDPLNPADAEQDIDKDKTGRSRPDGLINLFEFWNNTDPTNIDTDGDFLSDFEEIVQGFDVKINGRWEHYFTCATSFDTDKDDNPDDEDGDNYYGSDEEYLKDGPQGEPLDNDGDGRADEETDLNDFNECFGHLRGYITNASAPDSDGDGIDDWTEIFTDREPDIAGIQSTDPTLSDTDGDGLTDLQEILGVNIWLPGRAVKVLVRTHPLRVDSDNDGLSDGLEIKTDFDPRPGERGTVYLNPIRDSLTNDIVGYETKYKDSGLVNSTDPQDEDTDDDGMNDGYEYDNSDLDKDGMPTWWEEAFGLFRMRPTFIDTDGNGVLDSEEDFDLDGFSNLEEFKHRTDPNNDDTDNNGIIDSQESWIDDWGRPTLLRYPIYGDTDNDLMPDWWENLYGLNPGLNDSWLDLDGDGFANVDEYIYNTNVHINSPNDWWNHPITYSPHAVDEDRDNIGDWWEKYYWGSKEACDPSANSDGPPDYNDGDNWTNLMEWQYASLHPQNRYRTVPVYEFTDQFGNKVFGNDTDGDGKNDDMDPKPVIIPIQPVERPMQPVTGAASLNPLFPGDLFGDTDNDNMDNLEEFRRPLGQTDPTDPDSDQDGIPDGWEWGYGKYDNVTETVNIDPLDPTDALEDPDQDGINYSRKWMDDNGNRQFDEGELWDIQFIDFNEDGLLDPLWENETFCNLEEYLMGLDIDADGMLENTTDPNMDDTDEDGLSDGFEVFFSDVDRDGLPNWFEILFKLNPNDAKSSQVGGVNGSDGDPDGDGYNNTAEYRNKPWPTNPNDADSFPGSGIIFGRSIEDLEDPESVEATAATPAPMPERFDELVEVDSKR